MDPLSSGAEVVERDASLLSPTQDGGDQNIQKIRDSNNITWAELDVGKFTLVTAAVSVAENVLFYPFHLLKTREQVDKTQKLHALSTKETVAMARNTVKEGGVRGLYRGFWSSSFGSIPSYVVYLVTYSWTKHMCGWDNPHVAPTQQQKIWVPFVAGAIADVASIAFYVPVDVVVQRLQLKDSKYKGVTDAVRSIWKEDGPKGFFRGFGATLTYSVVGSITWWITYENAKAALAGRFTRTKQSLSTGEKPPDRVAQFVSGFIAGGVAAVACQPIDVVKTRLQTQGAGVGGQQGTRYTNLWHGMKTALREEGVRAFSKGLIPRALSRAPLSAISSVSYELMLYYCRK
eukprot:gnl/Hemi2/5145_TR1797_c0_g1_i1.p1 gnl/Hemi2/5145_TR1797_c0_g1~~gnl/Hemi2/5145_TR1797_c0_g1_i1.p1  ORF type:complete len:346 (-),score=74.77 gnl/Hemi2/5145_TR1797_c0_g1_i1:57-1094(-)